MDEFDLEAIGNHGFIPNTWPGPNSPGGAMSEADALRYQTELEFAAILGMPFMGTGNDPTSANNRNIEPWTIAGEKWEALNRLSLEWGIYLYPHNHSPAYHFLQDGPMVEVTVHRVTGEPIPPMLVRGESGKRLMQHYIDITDPTSACSNWTSIGHTSPSTSTAGATTGDGNRVEDIFDPLAHVAMQTKRYPLFHAKDGEATGEATRRRQRLRNRPVRQRATSTSRTSSRTWAPRASTTRTTSRTTPLAAAPTQAGHSATP